MLKINNDTVLSIPVPRTTQYVYRGMKNTKVPDTYPVSIRWTNDDRFFIDQQAGRIGITFSEFVRWVAYYAAVEVGKIDHITSFKLTDPDGAKKEVIKDFSDWE